MCCHLSQMCRFGGCGNTAITKANVAADQKAIFRRCVTRVDPRGSRAGKPGLAPIEINQGWPGGWRKAGVAALLACV